MRAMIDRQELIVRLQKCGQIEGSEFSGNFGWSGFILNFGSFD